MAATYLLPQRRAGCRDSLNGSHEWQPSDITGGNHLPASSTSAVACGHTCIVEAALHKMATMGECR
jgi:hypothetical protein